MLKRGERLESGVDLALTLLNLILQRKVGSIEFE